MNNDISAGVNASLEEKRACLQKTLEEIGECVLAFSGGVDSTLLLAAAVRALGKRVEAVMVNTPYVPGWELEEAQKLARTLDAHLHIVEMDLPDTLKDNPERRCYLCKRQIFSRIEARAKTGNKKKIIIDGSNADDGKAYRPGMQALREMGVRSPLAECGLTKGDIRELAKSWNLEVWNKPAYSCLLTRMPHGSAVYPEILALIEKAEEFLIGEGFPAVRVRTHGDSGAGYIARIEVPPEDREHLCRPERMDKIDGALRRAGYRYVTLDLAGYRSGSMDPITVQGAE
ncbi:MAG: ATP-dependent sacrificial sulfur transferase LarE [Spirochaetia bacterium]